MSCYNIWIGFITDQLPYHNFSSGEARLGLRGRLHTGSRHGSESAKGSSPIWYGSKSSSRFHINDIWKWRISTGAVDHLLGHLYRQYFGSNFTKLVIEFYFFPMLLHNQVGLISLGHSFTWCIFSCYDAAEFQTYTRGI